jgi:hypothetical protein
MNPTGPIGPRSIGVFAFAVGLVVKQVLHGPARRVMHTVGGLRGKGSIPMVDDPRVEKILLLFKREEHEGRGADCQRFPAGSRPEGIPLDPGERVYGIYKISMNVSSRQRRMS